MKKYFFSIFIFVTHSLYAQKIDGIGPLKIGKTKISIIDSFQANGYTVLQQMKSEDPFANRGNSLEKIVKEKSGDEADPIIKYQRVFNVSILSISGIEIKDVDLSFYKDTLYSIIITSPSEDFTNAIQTKYGHGSVKSIKKKVTCTSKMAGNYDLFEEDYTTTYRNDVINAYSYLSKYYDDHCDKKYFEMFEINDVKKSALINTLQKKEIKAREEADKKALKSKLDNF